jgi:hypothetical protein
MSLDRRFVRPLGALSILASDPMIEGGIMAARSFLQEGDSFRLAVSALSTIAAILLLVAGVLLCFKHIGGRTLAYVSASLSVPISVFSALIGLMGSHALMYGAGYPIVIVLLLKRATPSNGLPVPDDTAPVRPHARGDHAQLRATLA